MPGPGHGQGHISRRSPVLVPGEPNGFADRTASTISKVDGTLTFTIAPAVTSYLVYCNGRKYYKTAAESVVWTDVEGLHFFYFDLTATLTHTVDPAVFLASGTAQVCALYWDATNSATIYFGEERHGPIMDFATHYHLHETIGTQWDEGYDPTGMTTDGDGSSDTHAQLAIGSGEIHDEDLAIAHSDGSPQDLSPIAQVPVLYRLGVGGPWRLKTANNFPIIYDGEEGYTGANGRVPYNLDTAGTWSLSEVGQNNYVVYTFFATTEVSTPIVAMIGQATYGTLGAARLGAADELQNLLLGGLPLPEMAPLYSVIVKTATTFSNTPAAIFVTVDGTNDFVDWRGADTLGGAGSGGGVSLTIPNVWTAAQTVLAKELTAGASIATDASLSNVFFVELDQNSTLANPTNLQEGGTYVWHVSQAAGANYTLAYGALFEWPGGTAHVMTATNAAYDVITAVYRNGKLLANALANFS